MTNPLADDLDHILANTEGLWDELKGKKVFITGGTGFFGCWLLESFAWANNRLDLRAEVTVLTRNPEAFKRKAPHLAGHPAIRFHTGDVRAFDFPSGKFSHVIHAATEASATLNAQDPTLMFDTIVEGTRRTLDFAKQCGAKKLLLTSSGAVYGKQPPELTHIPEDYLGAPYTCDPNSAYGEGKRAAELFCTLYSRKYGFEAKIARCFAFVGPYLPLDRHFAIGNFIRDGLNGGPIHVKGDGTPYRSYLYAADLAIWLWTILFKGEFCRPYNVGSEGSMTIHDLAKTVAISFDSEIKVNISNPQPFNKYIERYVPDTQRANSELGLQQIVKLQNAIEKTAQWKLSRGGNL